MSRSRSGALVLKKQKNAPSKKKEQPFIGLFSRKKRVGLAARKVTPASTPFFAVISPVSLVSFLAFLVVSNFFSASMAKRREADAAPTAPSTFLTAKKCPEKRWRCAVDDRRREAHEECAAGRHWLGSIHFYPPFFSFRLVSQWTPMTERYKTKRERDRPKGTVLSRHARGRWRSAGTWTCNRRSISAMVDSTSTSWPAAKRTQEPRAPLCAPSG